MLIDKERGQKKVFLGPGPKLWVGGGQESWQFCSQSCCLAVTPSAIGALRSLSTPSSLLSAPVAERYGMRVKQCRSESWLDKPRAPAIVHHCQPGDPAECSWGCFTPRQYCSQERGAIHSISLLIILFHICHKHCTGVIENLQNKKMMIPSRLHLMVSTVRETELLELKHWWHHQPSPTSMSSSRWALQNLGGAENCADTNNDDNVVFSGQKGITRLTWKHCLLRSSRWQESCSNFEHCWFCDNKYVVFLWDRVHVCQFVKLMHFLSLKMAARMKRIILAGCGAEGFRAWEEEGGDGGELGQHAHREAGEEWTVM